MNVKLKEKIILKNRNAIGKVLLVVMVDRGEMLNKSFLLDSIYLLHLNRNYEKKFVISVEALNFSNKHI